MSAVFFGWGTETMDKRQKPKILLLELNDMERTKNSTVMVTIFVPVKFKDILKTIAYANLSSALRLAPHGIDLPIPIPYVNLDYVENSRRFRKCCSEEFNIIFSTNETHTFFQDEFTISLGRSMSVELLGDRLNEKTYYIQSQLSLGNIFQER